MNITTKILKNGVQAKSEYGWVLTVPFNEIPVHEQEEWVARRLVRATWPTGSFSLAYVSETATTKEWFAHA